MTVASQAREYERRYHEDLYGNHELFTPGTWLYKPAGYVIKAFDLVPKHDYPRVLDLGGGVGRHSIPAAKYFGADSEVVCVDLLESAIEKLRFNAKEHKVEKNIVGVVSDVETYELGDKAYELILSISCIEHIPTKQGVGDLIGRLQAATVLEGVHCFMMITNNEWVDSVTGEKLTPLIEQNLRSEDAISMLKELYAGWNIHDISAKDWEAMQLMDGRDVVLKSTCVQFTAQKSL